MEFNEGQKKYFTRQLNDWHYTDNDRSLPWKEEKDPYKIWLSEIILQQTRAEQGLPYYLKFTETYPTINHLAAANDEDAFRLWQGLGYYNRCKNMLSTARHISQNLDGKFPDTYDDILILQGVGPYTAAAIASFAFGLPYAVADGNVYRVLARYFGIDVPFDTTEGKKLFQSLAQELLNTQKSAAHNQAIMDLGATICTPQIPKCNNCPLQKRCIAFNQGLIADLPVRSKKQAVRNRYFHYLLLTCEDKIWIRKRDGKDIWQNLFEPYLIEAEQKLDAAQLTSQTRFKMLNIKKKPVFEGHLMQRLTHQLIETHFFSLHLSKVEMPQLADGNWVSINTLKNYAFPKTVLSFLEKKFYF